MIPVGKYRVEPYGCIEILVGAAIVTEVVFCDASEKETPIVRAVKSGEHVELFYGIGVFAVRQSLPAAPHEHVLVVLCECAC